VPCQRNTDNAPTPCVGTLITTATHTASGLFLPVACRARRPRSHPLPAGPNNPDGRSGLPCCGGFGYGHRPCAGPRVAFGTRRLLQPRARSRWRRRAADRALSRLQTLEKAALYGFRRVTMYVRRAGAVRIRSAVVATVLVMRSAAMHPGAAHARLHGARRGAGGRCAGSDRWRPGGSSSVRFGFRCSRRSRPAAGTVASAYRREIAGYVRSPWPASALAGFGFLQLWLLPAGSPTRSQVSYFFVASVHPVRSAVLPPRGAQPRPVPRAPRYAPWDRATGTAPFGPHRPVHPGLSCCSIPVFAVRYQAPPPACARALRRASEVHRLHRALQVLEGRDGTSPWSSAATTRCPRRNTRALRSGRRGLLLLCLKPGVPRRSFRAAGVGAGRLIALAIGAAGQLGSGALPMTLSPMLRSPLAVLSARGLLGHAADGVYGPGRGPPVFHLLRQSLKPPAAVRTQCSARWSFAARRTANHRIESARRMDSSSCPTIP